MIWFGSYNPILFYLKSSSQSNYILKLSLLDWNEKMYLLIRTYVIYNFFSIINFHYISIYLYIFSSISNLWIRANIIYNNFWIIIWYFWDQFITRYKREFHVRVSQCFMTYKKFTAFEKSM